MAPTSKVLSYPTHLRARTRMSTSSGFFLPINLELVFCLNMNRALLKIWLRPSCSVKSVPLLITLIFIYFLLVSSIDVLEAQGTPFQLQISRLSKFGWDQVAQSNQFLSSSLWFSFIFYWSVRLTFWRLKELHSNYRFLDSRFISYSTRDQVMTQLTRLVISVIPSFPVATLLASFFFATFSF